MSQDPGIVKRKVGELMAASGGSVSTKAVAQVVQSLGQRYGENLTIDGVCEALVEVALTALELRNDLKGAKR